MRAAVFLVCVSVCQCLSDSSSVDLSDFGGRVATCPRAGCACAPGLTGEPCASCPAGTFKSGHGDGACVLCGARATSLPGARSAAECVCEPGQRLLAGACGACGAGTYKAYFGAGPCAPCPANASSQAGSSALADCLCVGGFSGSAASACTACAAGRYKHGAGPATCTECPVDTYSESAALASIAGCLPCQNHSSTEARLGRAVADACVCDAGYYMAAGTCQTCARNSHCPGGNGILNCTQHSHGGPGLVTAAQCVCDHGYYRSGTVCQHCVADHWCAEDAMTACPADSASPGGSQQESACVCLGGFERLA